MRIRVKPIGIVRRYLSEQDIEVSPVCTARELMRHFQIPGQLRMVAFVNGKKCFLDTQLGDDDEVKLVSLVTGG